MPRLNTVTPETAEGGVKETFGQLTTKMGKVINIFQGMGNSSAALNAYLSMSAALSEGELTTEDREVIYLAVSQLNDCNYCVSAHTAISRNAGMTDDQIMGARTWSPEGPRHQALLAFIKRVIDTKGFVDDEDVTAVREAGLTDGQIAESIGYIGLATYSNLFNHVYDTPLDFPAAPSIGAKAT